MRRVLLMAFQSASRWVQLREPQKEHNSVDQTVHKMDTRTERP
jgi:hypothetical protein